MGYRPGRWQRKSARLACALCLLGLAVGAAAALAAAGNLDNSFSGDGRQTTKFAAGSDRGYGVAIQRNGRIVVAGHSDQGAETADFDFALARYMPNGSLDQSFSGDGRQTTKFANGGNTDVGSGVAIQPDGRIVVAGYSIQGATGANFAVARYRANGSLDQSFSGDGRRTLGFANGANSDFGNGVAIQADGKIVVVGSSNRGGANDDFAVARLKANGGLDQSFSADGRRTFGFANDSDLGRSVAIQQNGKIVVAGSSFQNSTGNDFAVARLNPGGSLDQSFSADGRRTFGFANGGNSDLGRSVAIQQNGKIVVAGSSFQSSTGNDFAVARLNPGGSLDQSFSGDGKRITDFIGFDDRAQDIAIEANGRIVVAGFSDQGTVVTFDYVFAVVRYMPNGGLDQSFSGDGKQTTSFGIMEDIGNGVAIQSDGRIVVAGYSDQGDLTADDDFAVARYLGS